MFLFLLLVDRSLLPPFVRVHATVRFLCVHRLRAQTQRKLSGRIPFERFEELMAAATAATADICAILKESLRERTIKLLKARGES